MGHLCQTSPSPVTSSFKAVMRRGEESRTQETLSPLLSGTALAGAGNRGLRTQQSQTVVLLEAWFKLAYSSLNQVKNTLYPQLLPSEVIYNITTEK